jgi:hypothetical protein
MVKNFVCEICAKSFNTTQHLNQHKNKKKKCLPASNLLTMSSSKENNSNNSQNVSEKEKHNFISANNSQLSSTEILLNSLIGNSDNSSYNSKSSSNSTINSSEFSTTSIPGLVDIFLTYKNVLDENKKLAYENLYLTREINEFKTENSFLKQQIELVDSFIMTFENSYEKYECKQTPKNVSDFTDNLPEFKNGVYENKKYFKDKNLVISDLTVGSFNEATKIV